MPRMPVSCTIKTTQTLLSNTCILFSLSVLFTTPEKATIINKHCEIVH